MLLINLIEKALLTINHGTGTTFNEIVNFIINNVNESGTNNAYYSDRLIQVFIFEDNFSKID